jgi:hypothetical protein
MNTREKSALRPRARKIMRGASDSLEKNQRVHRSGPCRRLSAVVVCWELRGHPGR